MSDISISNLNPGTPASTDVIPFSNGTTTQKVQIQSLPVDYNSLINKPTSSGVPSGFIGMWSGAANAIPSGWFLCDGNNGTPNLVDKFVLGAGTSTPAVGTIGGSKDAIVVAHTHTATDSGHSHSYTRPAGNNNQGGGAFGGGGFNNTSTGSGFANITIGSTGSSGTNANMPPYYALCYIMKS